MKKALFLLMVLLNTNILFGQNLVYTPAQHRIDTVIMENFEAYDINIGTPTPEAITYRWKLISNTFPAAWSYSLCDLGSCYVGIPSTIQTMNPISLAQSQNGDQGFLKINLTCGYNYGNGKVVIYVYDMNDVNRGDTISFDVRWPAPNSVVETSQENNLFELYPNPANEIITIENSADEILNGVIINAIGESVMNFDVARNSKNTFSISELDKGIYFVSIVKGDTRYVEKLVVH